jgi:hypothetical protein
VGKTKWTVPVDEVVAMATGWVMERGYTFHDRMGRQLAEQFYTGTDRNRAARKLHRLLEAAIAQAIADRRAAQQDEYNRMADQLTAEGWQYQPDPTGIDAGLWLHSPTYTSVNRMGGFFRTWEEATHVTFYSATRSVLRDDEPFF